MRGQKPRPAWTLLPLTLVALAAHATDSDAPGRCAGIGDDRARLACYDGIFGRPAPPAAGPAAAAADVTPAGNVTSGAAAPAATTSRETDFGLTEAAKRARDPRKAQEQMTESITGTVAAIGRRPAGELTMTLENGQVWTEVTWDPRLRVAVGDTVTIKRAALGSYLLVTGSRYATRVRRVK